mgnify:CR=1 FL=1
MKKAALNGLLFFVSSFVFPEYRRNRSLLDGAEKTKINKNRRKYMEDTKKQFWREMGKKMFRVRSTMVF